MTFQRVHNAARSHRRQMKKSIMAICRTQFWFVIFVIFSMWSLLIYLNYSSVINSVALVAKFYVYSANHQESNFRQTAPSSGRNGIILQENDHDVNEGIGEGDDDKRINGVERKEKVSFVNGTVNGMVDDDEIHRVPVRKRKTGEEEGGGREETQENQI
ncbi:hypothetical protein Nepgr_007438 [Nepenthes gracilis]|uniref:Transmembrane protein n=1 Tax=Nepenthes gracilis TaxID=150966 RepID=A0AAD3S6U6_NEPGR|nr:hypothetical protein Nepgr_007438 [Nepenthes gracilis]